MVGTSRPKRIIICCDGTWQSAVSGEKNVPSNVTRLARCLERVGTDPDGKQWDQVVWYDSGVGTTSGFLGRKFEGAIGQGLEGNVIEAYNFCVLNYSVGDQIMCFGFSRGAYTARSIAGLISDIGICEPSKLNNFFEIWQLYKQTKAGERFYGSDAYFDYADGVLAEPEDQPEDLGYKNRNQVWKIQPHGHWTAYPETRDIQVVGVYDTVGALGMPSVMGYEAKFLFGPDKLKFHNVRLNPNIKHAFHALALDEHREAFSPTLWHLPEVTPATEEQIQKQRTLKEDLQSEWYKVRENKKVDKTTRDKAKEAFYTARRDLYRLEDTKIPQPELLQVWFPGVHINIGGGSSDSLENKGDLEETSNMTFAWMLDQIKPYVSVNKTTVMQEAKALQDQIYQLNEQVAQNEKRIAEQKEKDAKASYLSWGLKKIGSAATTVASTIAHPLTKAEVPAPRSQGWGTGTIIDSYTSMYWANGSKPRHPGSYSKDKTGDTPGQTNEFIHPSVGFRMAVTKNATDKAARYAPAHLDDTKFKRQKTSSGYEYIIEGTKKPMTEWKLPVQPKNFQSPFDSPFERLAVLGDGAKEYVNQLDKEYGNPSQSMSLPF